MFDQTKFKQLIQAADSKRATHALIKLVMFETQLSAKRTKYRPSSTRTKHEQKKKHRMFDGLQILSNTTKQHQTRSNNATQGVQTVKCLATKQV